MNNNGKKWKPKKVWCRLHATALVQDSGRLESKFGHILTLVVTRKYVSPVKSAEF